MNRPSAATTPAPDHGTSSASDDKLGAPLVTVGPSQLENGDPWPLNFIVPQSGAALPTVHAADGADDPPATLPALLQSQTARAAEVDDDAPWVNTAASPLYPQQPRAAASSRPAEERLPVLTVRAEPPADAWYDELTHPSRLQQEPDPFAPTMFGPKLRQLDDETIPPLHADPAAAPARSDADSGLGFWVLLLLALLALGLVGWWWLYLR